MKNNQEEIDDVNSQGDAEIESPAQDQGHGFDNPNYNLLNLTVADGAHNLLQDNTVNLTNPAQVPQVQVQGNGFSVPQINTVNEANQAQGRGNLQDNPVNHEIIAQGGGDPQDDTVNHEVPVPVLTQGHDFLQDNAVNQADLAQVQVQGYGFGVPQINTVNEANQAQGDGVLQDNLVNHEVPVLAQDNVFFQVKAANQANPAQVPQVQVQGYGFGVPQINTVNEANQAQGRGNLQDNPVNHEIIARNRGDPQDDTVNHEVPVPVLTQGHDFLQDNAVNQADLAQGHGFEFLAQGHDVLQVNAVNHLGRGQGIMYGIQRNNQDQNNPRARNQNLVELRENLIENVVNEWRHLKSLKVKKADLERRISNKEVLINIITNEENFINNHYQSINE